jgi:hypothetical protein
MRYYSKDGKWMIDSQPGSDFRNTPSAGKTVYIAPRKYNDSSITVIDNAFDQHDQYNDIYINSLNKGVIRIYQWIDLPNSYGITEERWALRHVLVGKTGYMLGLKCGFVENSGNIYVYFSSLNKLYTRKVSLVSAFQLSGESEIVTPYYYAPNYFFTTFFSIGLGDIFPDQIQRVYMAPYVFNRTVPFLGVEVATLQRNEMRLYSTSPSGIAQTNYNGDVLKFYSNNSNIVYDDTKLYTDSAYFSITSGGRKKLPVLETITERRNYKYQLLYIDTKDRGYIDANRSSGGDGYEATGMLHRFVDQNGKETSLPRYFGGITKVLPEKLTRIKYTEDKQLIGTFVIEERKILTSAQKRANSTRDFSDRSYSYKEEVDSATPIRSYSWILINGVLRNTYEPFDGKISATYPDPRYFFTNVFQHKSLPLSGSISSRSVRLYSVYNKTTVSQADIDQYILDESGNAGLGLVSLLTYMRSRNDNVNLIHQYREINDDNHGGRLYEDLYTGTTFNFRFIPNRAYKNNDFRRYTSPLNVFGYRVDNNNSDILADLAISNNNIYTLSLRSKNLIDALPYKAGSDFVYYDLYTRPRYVLTNAVPDDKTSGILRSGYSLYNLVKNDVRYIVDKNSKQYQDVIDSAPNLKYVSVDGDDEALKCITYKNHIEIFFNRQLDQSEMIRLSYHAKDVRVQGMSPWVKLRQVVASTVEEAEIERKKLEPVNSISVGTLAPIFGGLRLSAVPTYKKVDTDEFKKWLFPLYPEVIKTIPGSPYGQLAGRDPRQNQVRKLTDATITNMSKTISAMPTENIPSGLKSSNTEYKYEPSSSPGKYDIYYRQRLDVKVSFDQLLPPDHYDLAFEGGDKSYPTHPTNTLARSRLHYLYIDDPYDYPSRKDIGGQKFDIRLGQVLATLNEKEQIINTDFASRVMNDGTYTFYAFIGIKSPDYNPLIRVYKYQTVGGYAPANDRWFLIDEIEDLDIQDLENIQTRQNGLILLTGTGKVYGLNDPDNNIVPDFK